MKGSEFVVCEVLTKNRYDLFLRVKKMFDKNSVWTIKGNIIVFINNTKFHVNSEEDLLKLRHGK